MSNIKYWSAPHGDLDSKTLLELSTDRYIQRITKTKHSVTQLGNVKYLSASNPIFYSRALLKLSTERYKTSADSSIQRITKTKYFVTQHPFW